MKVSCISIAGLLFFWFVPHSAWSQPAVNQSDEWRSLLNHLIGQWELTGEMPARDLHQNCEAQWILDQHFLHMNCEATLPDTSGYRARYVIGFDSSENRYVFHLFDTFGASYSKTLGYGVADNNQITFDFDYTGQALRNTFIWQPEKQGWEMVLQPMNEQGQWELFARKKLTK